MRVCPESSRQQNAIILTLKSIIPTLEYEESTECFFGRGGKFLLKSYHKLLEFLFNSKELPGVKNFKSWRLIYICLGKHHSTCRRTIPAKISE